MRRNMIVFSVAVHIGVLAAMVLAAEKKVLRRPTAIAVTDAKKKEKPKPPPPKPPEPEKPKPKPAAPKPTAPVPTAPSEAPPPVKGPAPVDTGLQLGNSDGPGIDVGGPRGGTPGAADPRAAGGAPGPKKSGPAPKKHDDKGEEECAEDATRPEPLSTTDLNDVYTSSKARVEGIEGKMSLRVTVDKDGSVSRVDVLAGIDPQLDDNRIGPNTIDGFAFPCIDQGTNTSTPLACSH